MTSLLVTGGAGFIGCNCIRWVLQRDPGVHITNLDLLTYAGNLESLTDVSQRFSDRYRFVHGDIRNSTLVASLLHSVDGVIHLAAESHVDRSILAPAVFAETNIVGTLALLEACRTELRQRPRAFRFLHVSTDEVYGTLGPHDLAFTEATPLAPNSPYAASKAAADLLVRACQETYDFPAIITRASNNYGPYQFPEKLIPLMLTRALHDRRLPLHGDGLQIRDWLHVEDHVEALWAIFQRGQLGRIYNIGGEAERTNLSVVQQLLQLLEKPESLLDFVDDRPGNDRRYAINNGRIRGELGWYPRHTFEDGLLETVRWYREHHVWYERVLSEAYRTTTTLYEHA